MPGGLKQEHGVLTHLAVSITIATVKWTYPPNILLYITTNATRQQNSVHAKYNVYVRNVSLVLLSHPSHCSCWCWHYTTYARKSNIHLYHGLCKINGLETFCYRLSSYDIESRDQFRLQNIKRVDIAYYYLRAHLYSISSKKVIKWHVNEVNLWLDIDITCYTYIINIIYIINASE